MTCCVLLAVAAALQGHAADALAAGDKAAGAKVPRDAAARKAFLQARFDPSACSKIVWHNVRQHMVPLDDGTTFVTTGSWDGWQSSLLESGSPPPLDAMWIRDAAAQVQPLVSLAAGSADIQRVVEGAVLRMARYILLDPYANAYNVDKARVADWERQLNRAEFVHEGKFELDSGAYFFKILASYVSAVPSTTLLTRVDGGVNTVREAVRLLLHVYRIEQNHDHSEYRFKAPLSAFHNDHPGDILDRGGRGVPVKPTGMVWTAFRPSDDRAQYGYHVPDNIFLAQTLGPVASLAASAWAAPGPYSIADQAAALQAAIKAGVEQHGVANVTVDGVTGPIYCYEVDGFGGCNQMDDANVPSLLAVPYLDPDVSVHDPAVYARTRSFVLSRQNKEFVELPIDEGRAEEGETAELVPSYRETHPDVTVTLTGVGSPHTQYGSLWPMSMVVEGLTGTRADRDRVLEELLELGFAAGSDLLPESVSADAGLGDAGKPVVTRRDFGWADALYGELLVKAGRCEVDAQSFVMPPTRRVAAGRLGDPLPTTLDRVPEWRLQQSEAVAVAADGSLAHLRQTP